MDFTRYPLSGRYYGGTERKIGIEIKGVPYMLKFQKKTAFGNRNNHISEYLGCHIFEYLGFEVQETYLGTYKGEQVVACKDFNTENVQFVPFNDVGESSLDQDKETYQYDYEDIVQMLEDNAKLTDVEYSIEFFWRMYIVDALLGNFDRHGGNWGFVKENDQYRMAPVFDNGSCLFPNLTNEKDMMDIIESEEETKRRVYQFQTSQIKLHGKKSSYYEVISSLEFEECCEALEDICEKIDIEKIYDIVDGVDFMSNVQRNFYKHMIKNRYEMIIKDSYKVWKGGR